MHARGMTLATWVISKLAGKEQRDAFLGDLAEEHARIAAATSVQDADRWYWQQLRASARPLLWSRIVQSDGPACAGVALLAYLAVGLTEWGVEWLLGRASGGAGAHPALGLFITFPVVVLIAYRAAGWRRPAALLLGAMMLLAVTVMSLTSTETLPRGVRIAYFIAGPAASLIGSALASRRSARS